MLIHSTMVEDRMDSDVEFERSVVEILSVRRFAVDLRNGVVHCQVHHSHLETHCSERKLCSMIVSEHS